MGMFGNHRQLNAVRGVGRRQIIRSAQRICSVSLLALATALPGCGQQANLTPEGYTQYGGWTVTRYTNAKTPAKVEMCSAVVENIQRSSLRIATTKQGLTVSVNGASPSGSGESPKMYLYTDEQSKDPVKFAGKFWKDPAYEYDHWLGKQFTTDTDLSSKLMTAETLTASIYSPGNRTGNDWPESHFELGDMNGLTSVLQACSDGKSASDLSDIVKPVPAKCEGDAALPASGMCLSAARFQLHVPKGGTEELAPNCKWSVSDARLSENEFLVYRALKCGSETSKLVPVSEGYPVRLNALVAPTAAYTDGFGFEQSDGWKDPIVTVFKYDGNLSHLDEIPKIAKKAAADAGMTYSDGCVLEYDEYSGLLALNDKNEADMENPNWNAPCGPLGSQEGLTVYWSYLRSGYVAAIHYPFDGYFGLDWNKMILVKPDSEGGWTQQ